MPKLLPEIVRLTPAVEALLSSDCADRTGASNEKNPTSVPMFEYICTASWSPTPIDVVVPQIIDENVFQDVVWH